MDPIKPVDPVDPVKPINPIYSEQPSQESSSPTGIIIGTIVAGLVIIGIGAFLLYKFRLKLGKGSRRRIP